MDFVLGGEALIFGSSKDMIDIYMGCGCSWMMCVFPTLYFPWFVTYTFQEGSRHHDQRRIPPSLCMLCL